MRNRPLRNKACQPTRLTSACPQTYVNDHPVSSAMTCGQHFSLPVVVGFPDRDHRYKSVATQIPHDVGLAPIPDTRQKNLLVVCKISLKTIILSDNVISRHRIYMQMHVFYALK